MSGKRNKKGRTGPSAGALRRAKERDRKAAPEREAHRLWVRDNRLRLALGPVFAPGARSCHAEKPWGGVCGPAPYGAFCFPTPREYVTKVEDLPPQADLKSTPQFRGRMSVFSWMALAAISALEPKERP